ncbi:lipopolysaccharide export system protein LptC [Roseovarius tolerans]|uniref:Lipopolysaccharide export system protein LptC n=1 Tax=Roseovarius tolerans TaxID=74031 RepID=A0A1H8H562_9RHOB|nr:LPS export ABC transporter periplasmic protein LptC [Roseovarius tolerans]SEN51159.1 lipopolysaccharide export system protein LptC [Roseovarius tolerans]
MARADNTYSRVVAGMKVLLPLIALGLLSTLFLISRTVDPSKSVPVAQADVEKRAQDMGASNPSFAGVTDTGDEILFSAGIARPGRDVDGPITADAVTAQIRLAAGTTVDITARAAEFDQRAMQTQLRGDVQITTSTGYVIDTDRLDMNLDALNATTPDTVTATGPLGDLTAGQMVLRNANGNGAAELLFTEGVKLIYQPPDVGD